MLLSFVSLGSSAAAAGAAVEALLFPLLAFTAVSLGYAHYQVWVRGRGNRLGKFIVVGNSLLATVLWVLKLPV